MKHIFKFAALGVLGLFMQSCGNNTESSKQGSGGLMAASAAEKVYVAPGEHDEYYGFFSGGFSGQLSVYGLPSGRMLKVIPVFSQDAEKGYGYNEETKAMLNTSYGFVPWGDLHHLDISQTNGELDGRWIFTHENNTPRVARIDLTTFETVEILEIPNSAGNHSFAITENTEYLVAGTRFSIPSPQKDMTIDEMKGNFKGPMTFVKVDQETGGMEIAFQVIMPGFSFDLAHPGRAASHGWMFATTYNSEEANTLLEVNASQNDKDYIVAVNWKKIEEYVNNGGGEMMPAEYAHNVFDHHKHSATSTMKEGIMTVNPTDVPGAIYFLPTPKSPHGCDVDPTGEYIVGSGKLAAQVTVHSFSKMLKAIEEENFIGEVYGMPVLNYDAVLAGIVEEPGLGPLHTEFDGKGNAYTTFFISSEVVKWRLSDFEILDRKPTYYSVGHLMIPGGNSQKPFGEYLVAMNKITKDRYLPTGPEMNHSAQLYDISGEKMELLLDFPTIGEPHYAAGIPADIVKQNSKKIFRLDENEHKYAVKNESETRVERDGNEVHVYMSMVRSHFAPDNIEGIKVGDKVYFHVTNLEQDFDVPHGFAMIGANTAELLVMPGGTKTLLWEPKKEGVWPLYCTDFCSALHQEMQGYVRVSPANSNVELKWSLDGES
ncbi:Sec-dependent nitrous-oxide reductase [Salinimicrobium terrae]|uniref:Sec-dependent nitrous-oxide reductase n=1 Tax=Salinimicrobium terrae TaxID=470866 RepID=UPI000405FE58|nr:Sec-dependent nitrous-oxide reductase [Salinimicrobium terrae]